MSSAWRCARGSTLLIPSGPRPDQLHLFALLLDPVAVDGYGSRPQVLLASICSIKAGVPYDDACVLRAGDHPFIEHDSYVEYRFARLDPAEDVESRVKQGVFVQKEDCSAVLIRQIIVGALASRRINREYKALLNRVLFDDE